MPPAAHYAAQNGSVWLKIGPQVPAPAFATEKEALEALNEVQTIVEFVV